MNSSATNLNSSDAVIRFLIAALADESSWVRIGAAQGLARSYPNEGRERLKRHWSEIPPNSSEQFALALALEICGEDTFPLLAPMLQVDSAEQLVKALGFDDDDRWRAHDAWVNFLNARGESLPRGALRLLNEIRPIRFWRDRRQPSEPLEKSQADRYEIVAEYGESELEKVNGWVDNEEFKELSYSIFQPILQSLRSKDRDQIQSAVQRLLQLSLCEPDGWLRSISNAALVALGAEAGDLLIPSLWGNPPVVPTWEQLREFASHAEEGWSHKDLPPGAAIVELASYLATQTLTAFRDHETISTLVRVSVEGVTRAEKTLAQMPIEVSLPALFWAATNNADWAGRHRAATIIRKIITKDPDYAIHYHYVDWQKVDANLEWISDLISRSFTVPEWVNEPYTGGSLSWVRNQPATKLLLSNAIKMIPLIHGTKDVNYYTSRAWDSFLRFGKRLSSLTETKEETTDIALTVKRYLVINFPKDCVLEKPIQLALWLDIKPPEKETPSPEIALKFGSNEDQVDLLVLIKAPAFQISDYYHPLRVPLTESSPAVEFTLIPQRLGPQTIEIELLRGVERVGYSTLLVNVVAKGVQEGQAEVILFDGTGNRDLLHRDETRAIIQIDWNKDEGTLSYILIDPSLGKEPQDLGTSKTKILEAHVQTWIATQSKIIKDYLQQDYKTESDLQGGLLGLAAIGNTLFEQLTPPGLLELTQRWPSGSIVAIASNENWIPWELLAESANGPLLGERFQLVRTPRALVGEVLDTSEVVPVEADDNPCVEINRITSVVGDGIIRGDEPGAYSAEKTFGSARPFVDDLIEATFPEFKKAIRDADIIHFTCHGRGDPYYYLSLGEGAGRRLLVGQVKSLILRPGAVIFANACSSDKAELFLGEFQNFGWSFYKRGVRPFIGTLGPVPTKHAIAFAGYFYTRFIKDGLSVGQALRQARLDIAEEFRNPFYLFYCLYGRASTCRRIARSEFEG